MAAVSPLWLGSLRPEGLEFVQGDAPGWTLALSMAYGNSFSMSPGVLEAHRLLDGAGGELSREAIRNSTLYGKESYALDAETLRVDLEALYTSNTGFFGGMRMQSWKFGGTSLDGWPPQVHSWIGVGNAGRDDFPEGETFFGLISEGRVVTVEREAGLRMVSFDVWAGRVWKLGRRTQHRLWLSASIPLAEASEWRSGSFNSGVRWMAERSFDGFEFDGGVGWTRQGGRVAGGGPAADTFHAWLGLSVDLGRGVDANLLLRSDGSVYRDVVEGRVGRDSGEFSVGLGIPLSKKLRLETALGEDFPGMGMPPDFSIQTSIRWRLEAVGVRE